MWKIQGGSKMKTDDFDFEFGDAEEVKQEGASDEEAVTATSEDEE